MKRLEELRSQLTTKAQRLKELVSKDSVTDEEKTEKRSLLTECQTLKEDIADLEHEQRFLEGLDESIVTPPTGKQPMEKRDAQARGEVVYEPPVYRSFGEQLQDIITMTHDGRTGQRKEARERLQKAEKRMVMDKTLDMEFKRDIEQRVADGQMVGVGSAGGHFVQTDFATDIINHGFNNSAILPKTQRRELSGNSNSIEIYGIDETSRVNGSRGGGVTVYTKAELEQYTASKTKFAGIELKLNKLTGLLALSDEIMEDAAFLEGEVSNLFQEEFAFKVQDLLIRGSGAGEPLGIKNAPCLVTVAKENNQAADTIVAENIDKMVARVTGTRAEFFANRDTIPQLKSLYRTLDTNNVRPMFTQTSINTGILDGIPVTFIEQADTLGDVGDLMLCDWSAYVTATKGGIKRAESLELYFDYGQKVIRWTLRIDGQPRFRSSITPYKGSATVSPFVVLAARA